MQLSTADIPAGRLHYRRRWGAEPEGSARWRFAIWAPSARSVSVEVSGAVTPLDRTGDGFHSGLAPGLAGDPYMFIVDGLRVPDPAARAQAGHVHGPSQLVDPGARIWATDWHGRPWEEAVIYELHLGTFTPEGTFAAAAARMRELAALGITAIELMPVAQFPGRRGWGYDGVLPYAPHPAYGTPDEMKDLVETAQAAGLMVILDVVYNHFGPEGNALPQVAPEFFDPRRQTPWGAAIDYTRPAVRSFFLDNALAWLCEYRLDGLRLDAVHEIADPSTPDLVTELRQRIDAIGFARPIHLIAEDERNRPDYREAGAVTAEWNDDWHHAIHCALTGECEGYYASFAADPVGDLATALADGHVEQGQPRPGLSAPRGAPSAHLPWTAFVNANQTHDQIGNRPRGERLLALADPRAVEVAHALLLTAPFIPMLFIGEEAGETAPFLFFADFDGDLAEATRRGRQQEFAAFAGFSGAVPDPIDPATFEASRPFRGDPAGAAHWRALTGRLLALRAARIVPLMKSGRAGPARVTRTGPRSLSVAWAFRAGFVVAHVNLGAPPGLAPRTDPHDVAIGDVARDPYAFALIVSRP